MAKRRRGGGVLVRLAPAGGRSGRLAPGGVYHLYRGAVRLGTVRHEWNDRSWHLGVFTPSPAFHRLRGLFARDLDRLGDGGWILVCDSAADRGLELRRAGAARACALRVLVHVNGHRAWWR